MKTVHINTAIKAIGAPELYTGETNDCTVKALAVALAIPYDQAYLYAKRSLNRKRNVGTTGKVLQRAFSFDKSFTELKGKAIKTTYKQVDGKMLDRDMTIGTFARVYPSGTYYIVVSKHALVVKDGIVFDHSDKPKRRIKMAWKVEPIAESKADWQAQWVA
jgi:hypothetical protein